MDVFEDEPNMKPGLAECDNAVIVPHIASASFWTRAGMVSAVMHSLWFMQPVMAPFTQPHVAVTAS